MSKVDQFKLRIHEVPPLQLPQKFYNKFICYPTLILHD